jgi:fructose-1,6-bisphosphatase I
MASEEEPGIIPIPDNFRCGKYCLLFDPLDGSSNIDVNVPVGTIFSVVRKITRGTHGEMEDMLQPGRRQVAAGYVIYGSSTMMVYTTGQGAHAFTLDPSIGEFLLSHQDIRIPSSGGISRSTIRTSDCGTKMCDSSCAGIADSTASVGR